MSLSSIPVPTRGARPAGRVLIIDDNTELVGTLHAVLLSAEMGDGRALGTQLEVITASFGAEGLRLAKARGFDVAIVDVKLPDMSGVDLIRPLREASDHGEVVLITGFATMDAAMGALRSGAFAFIPKSFRPEELISTVQQAITKVQLKREREELEGRYRALVDLTDVLVVGLDTENRVALFNRKASALSGVGPDFAYGRSFLESWVAEGDQAKMESAVSAVRATGKAQEVEVTFVDNVGAVPSGRVPPRRIRWHLSSARDGEKSELVYGIGIDVTERRALEKRAVDAEALSAMGTLALNLAHEIRNPLNAAVLQLHLLGRHIDKLDVDATTRSTLHKKAQIVGSEIGRLNRLLTEFLELARPRSIAREPVHVGRLVDDVLDLERDSAAARGITLQRDIASDGCVALGDTEKLKQVVINLVVNAMEAMKEGGVLTAAVSCAPDRVTIRIEDTGPGIPTDVLANVFDPFFTTKEAGTGLGLSIVRKIVDQHAGDVRIESERGRGTAVVVTIPTR